MGILIGSPDDAVRAGGPVDAGARPYVVTVVNGTAETLTCVLLVVSRASRADRVVPLFGWHVAPGARHRFVLGATGDVRRYAGAAFIGDERVARLPAPGRAVELDPRDTPVRPTWTIRPREDSP